MRYVCLLFASLMISGCSGTAAYKINEEFHETDKWQKQVVARTAYMSADVRMVTARNHPVLKNEVICTEPSPDVAKALSTAFQINASVKAGAADVGAGVGNSSAEAIKELAGRTTALLALRDALYKACEGYANGSLGANAYAIVMARYGQLMTTLFLGQDAESSGAGTPGTTQSPVINLNNGGASTTSPPSSSNESNVSGNKPKQGHTAASTSDSEAPLVFARLYSAVPDGMIQLASYNSAADTQPPAPGNAAATDASGAAAPKSKQPTASNGATGNKTNPQPTNADSSSKNDEKTAPSNPGAWAVRMNEDYFDLDLNIGQMLFVSCLNEYDPTRLSLPVAGSDVQSSAGGNKWLRKLCDAVDDPDKLMTFGEGLAQAEKQSGHPGAPIDPWSSPPASKSTQNSSLVAQVQVALLAANCGPLNVTGKVDDQTLTAILLFQKRHKLTPTGVLDTPTLNALSSDQSRVQPSS